MADIINISERLELQRIIDEYDPLAAEAYPNSKEEKRCDELEARVKEMGYSIEFDSHKGGFHIPYGSGFLWYTPDWLKNAK
jgi:hypothetical protein